MSAYEKLAILISVFSVFLASLALGWNVYRDVILKPRLKVRMKICFILHGDYESPSKINIDATNFGPRKIKCTSIYAKNSTLLRRIFRRVQYAFIVHDYTDVYSTKLPCELEVGDTCNLFLDFNKGCFLSEPFTHIGISDSFGRTHWAPKKDVRKARREYEERFG